ncbi:MAG: hypothetical protein O7D86_05055 [Proteobacteria bacterium]|nr:hypothetical protein [Pseudomonadota bacterium]
MAASPKAPTVGDPLCRGWPCASSRLALNKNGGTLNHAFPSITGIVSLADVGMDDIQRVGGKYASLVEV